jgi:hypothetical protein
MDGVCLRATGRVLTMERRGLIIYSRVQKCRRQESMQGTFSRSKVTSEKMGVDADLLVQQTTSRRVKDKSADMGMAQVQRRTELGMAQVQRQTDMGMAQVQRQTDMGAVSVQRPLLTRIRH